jgi:hypothetical protein
MQSDVLKTIEGADGDLAEAALAIYNGPKKIALYVIEVGLGRFKAKQRRSNRRAIKREIRPQFKAGRVTGSIVLTKQAKERVVRSTERLFGPDGWMIGDLNIGQFNAEMLLTQAEREEASAKGSVINARLYRAFAAELKPGETVQQHFTAADFARIRRRVQEQSKSMRAELV